MARKKLSVHRHKEPEPNHAADHCDASHGHDEDEHVEAIRSLKSLNAILLKETAEKRRQVESLERRRDDLEVEVQRMGAAVKELEEELSRASEESVGLEVGRGVASCFLDVWRVETGDVVRGLVAAKEEEVRTARERAGEIGRALENERGKVREAVEERDGVVSELGESIETVRHLMEKLQGVEEARRLAQEGLEAAKMENERLGREKVEGERVLRCLMNQKEAVEKELMEVGKEEGELRGKVKELERFNEEIGRETKGKDNVISELGKEVARLKGIEDHLRKEEEKLRSRLFELESLHDVALEKAKEREREIGALSKEDGAKAAMILNMKGACDLWEEKLGMAEESLGEKERLIEEMEKKRIKVEELVDRKVEEIASLNKEVTELKDVIAGLKSSCCDQEEKSKAMLAEVSTFKEAVYGVKSEKDELEKLLDGERQNACIMASKLSEMEKKIMETLEESRAIQGERDDLIKDKTEVECKLSLCVEGKKMLEKRLSSAQQTIDDLEAKIKLAGKKYDQISVILKRTVVSLLKENGGAEESFLGEQKAVAEDFQVYAKELDAIKSVFRNKERAVEELKQQLEVFKESAARAQKEKGLWTLLSSATALVAAASVAYLARGR